MKKTLLSFLMLFTAAIWTQVEAATDYGIKVGETSVTSANASNILGNGYFSYNASSKTLTVKSGASLNNQGSIGCGIWNKSVDGLTIMFEGTASITARMVAIDAEKPTSINCPQGKYVYLKSTTSQALRAVGTTISLVMAGSSPAFLDIQAPNSAALAGYGNNSKIRIGSGCFFEIFAKGKSASGSLTDFDLGNVESVAVPSGAKFDSSSKAFVDIFGNTVTNLHIVPTSRLTTYSIWVGGVQVNNYNYSKIESPAITNGTAAYDMDAKVLSISGDIDMNGLNSSVSNNCVDIREQGVTVRVNSSGKTWRGGGSSSAFYTTQDVTFTTQCNYTSSIEDYDVEIDGNGKTGLIARGGKTITFNNARIKTTSIVGYSGQTNNKVAFTGDKTLVITDDLSNLASATVSGNNRFAYPLGVGYNTTDKRLKLNGSNFNGTAIIGACTQIPVYFGEHFINSIAAFDLLGDGSKDIRYVGNSTKGTLYLNNATFTNTGSIGSAISNRGLTSLTIDVSGENTLTSRMTSIDNSNMDVSSPVQITVKGSGTLNLKSTGYTPFQVANKGAGGVNLTIEDITLNINSTDVGICDYYGNSKLNLKNCTVDITSAQEPIKSFKDVTFTGCDVATPIGGYCENGKIYTYDGQEVTSGHVLITDFDKYGITIGGMPVNEYNADDILGDGKVYYNASRQELVLTDLKLTKSNYDNLSEFTIQGGDDNTPSDVTIRLDGENKIEGEVGLKWLGGKNVTLTGEGSLSIKAMTNAAIIDGGNLTIQKYANDEQGPTATFASLSDEMPAIVGLHGDEALTIDGSHVEISATVEPLQNFGTVNMENVYLISPKGAVFDDQKHCFVDGNGDPIKGQTIIFRPEAPTDYGFDVAGVDVDEMNADNITGEGIKEGKVSFDATTNTLTLDGVTMSAETGGLNITEFAGTTLTVKLIGENKCENEETAFQVNNLTPLEIIICGPGSFDGNISVKNANLTVKDGATLLKPLQGGRNGETLTVDNATLKCDKYTISDFASLTLANGMGIIEPVRGYYNDQMQELEDETGAPAWGYLIRPLTDEELAVRSINAESSARTIYNVQGQRTGKLQRGVNVVIDENGRTRKQLVK